MKALSLIVLSVIVMAVSLCAAACDCDAQWTWTPKAEHHAAACIVRCGGSAGSGTLVMFSDGGKSMVGVITAQHVVSSGRRAVCAFGRQSVVGQPCHDKHGSDVAWITLDSQPSGIKPIPFAATAPRVGDTTETLGYGGPRDILRHFSGRVASVSGSQTVLTSPCTHGDSGGGILVGGKLISVQSVGIGDGGSFNTHSGPWAWYRQSGVPHYHPIRRFLLRVITLGAIGPHPNRAQQWGLYPGQQQPGGT